MGLKDCIADLRQVREKHGYSNFDQAVRTLNRERVNPERDERKTFPWSKHVALYKKQRGICSICQDESKPMVLLKGKYVAIDHIDPNRTDFNADDNLGLAHYQCNAEKSSKSIQQLSKESGKSFLQIIKPGNRTGDESEES